MSLSLIPVSLSKQNTLSSGLSAHRRTPSVCGLTLLGAALEDVVVEVGAGAAGDAQDVEGARLLALMLVPMLYLLHALRLLRSCASLVTLVLAEKTFYLCQIML